MLVAPHGWGNPAGRVDTAASPVLLLEGAGRGALEGEPLARGATRLPKLT